MQPESIMQTNTIGIPMTQDEEDLLVQALNEPPSPNEDDYDASETTTLL